MSVANSRIHSLQNDGKWSRYNEFIFLFFWENIPNLRELYIYANISLGKPVLHFLLYSKSFYNDGQLSKSD